MNTCSSALSSLTIYVDLTGWHGHLAGSQDLLAVGGVDVLLQVGVARVLAHARPLLPHLAAARRRGRRVPDDSPRARGELQRVAGRCLGSGRRHHQHHRREGQECHHQLPQVLHGVSGTLTKKCRSAGSSE
ncbi:hypothetical protein D1007_30091 [Hordeum vulgare]|nr:hypothetical protein D1007_30091 [Hordeum vulgare]